MKSAETRKKILEYRENERKRFVSEMRGRRQALPILKRMSPTNPTGQNMKQKSRLTKRENATRTVKKRNP
jgi:hypothetical protein